MSRHPFPALFAFLLSLTLPSPGMAAPSDLAGIWWAKTYSPRLLPMDGKPLPFTAAGHAIYVKNAAGLKRKTLIDRSTFLCLPKGLPRALTTAYPMQIMLTPTIVVFAHEENRAYRTVNMTDRHANTNDWDPSFMGEGIGKWDGDTLVIDSTNFRADQVFLDNSGVPISENLHVIERLRVIDGGATLEDVITIEDPMIFTHPWSTKVTFSRRDDIQLHTDWVCGHAHRDVSAVTRKVR